MSDESYPLSSHEGQLVALPDFSKLAACWKFTDDSASKPSEGGPETYYLRMRAGSGYLHGSTTKPSAPEGGYPGGTEWWYSPVVPVGPLHDIVGAIYPSLLGAGPLLDFCRNMPGSETPNTSELYEPPLGMISLEWDDLREVWAYVARSWEPGGVEEVTLSPSGVVSYVYTSGTSDNCSDPETPDGRARDHTGKILVAWYSGIYQWLSGAPQYEGGWKTSQNIQGGYYPPSRVTMGYGAGSSALRWKKFGGDVVFFSDQEISLQVMPAGARNLWLRGNVYMCGWDTVLGTLSFDISEDPWE